MKSAVVWLKWVNHCAILVPKCQKCGAAALVQVHLHSQFGENGHFSVWQMFTH